MIALAGMWGDFHFAEQGVHFGDREDAARADRAVAGHGAGDGIDAFFQRQRFAERGKFVGEVSDQTSDVGLSQHRRHTAHEHRGGAKAFEVEAEI